ELRVSRDAARAPDARNDRHLIEVRLRVDEGPGKTVDGGPDPTTGAPDVRHALHPQERLHRILRVRGNFEFDFHQVLAHCAASWIALRIAFGSWTLPPA